MNTGRSWPTNGQQQKTPPSSMGSHLPRLITCDGAAGTLKAIMAVWGDEAPPVQRCLLHVHHNNIRDPTSRPKPAAGKALRVLSKRLLKTRTSEAAAHWSALLAQFPSQYKQWLNERPSPAPTPKKPSDGVRLNRPNGRHNHGRDPNLHKHLERLSKQGTLFRFLTAHPSQVQHVTTNMAESINARIDTVCHHHRPV